MIVENSNRKESDKYLIKETSILRQDSNRNPKILPNNNKYMNSP